MADDGFITPTEGFLFGMKLTDIRSAAKTANAELDAMRRELQEKVAGGLFNEAMAAAASAVTKEVADELRGDGTQRRFSDPANRAVRNEEFAEKTASNLRRLSAGKLTMSPAEIREFKARRLVK